MILDIGTIPPIHIVTMVILTEKEMGTTYNTLEKLLEHPDVKKFVEWRKKRL